MVTKGLSSGVCTSWMGKGDEESTFIEVSGAVETYK